MSANEAMVTLLHEIVDQDQANALRGNVYSLCEDHRLRALDLINTADVAAPAAGIIHAARRALNYIQNTESELDIKLECGDLLRAALHGEPA